MIQVWMIDDNGFYINKITFVEELGIGMTDIPLTVGYIKPQLADKVWVEGATEEEIEEWKQSQIDICEEPTDKERILKLEEEKTVLAENVYQLASILETMLGGTEDGQNSTTEETATD